ncbi:MAG: hypothetical protein QOH89_555 [Pseudonocardiales bacterium]|nr:hypothetical protein [Pseudonocardiales bacterium]
MTGSVPVLDHLVFAAPDLAAATRWFAERTGVQPVRGGSHPGLGTANQLVGLGSGGYLEIIGPDPAQPDPAEARPFGIDELTEPRLVTWAVRTDEIDALVAQARSGGYDPGEPRAMSRRTPDGELLEWRLTAPRLDYAGGLVPFLIDWGTTPHPTSRALPSTPLRALRATHSEPEPARSALLALRVDLAVDLGEPVALLLDVDGSAGPVRL